MSELEVIALPQVKTQCIHVSYDQEGHLVRCLDDAVVTQNHGWLCKAHSDQMDRRLNAQAAQRASNSHPNRDGELIKSIIRHDSAKIAFGTRVDVKVGTTTIHYLE